MKIWFNYDISGYDLYVEIDGVVDSFPDIALTALTADYLGKTSTFGAEFDMKLHT